MNALSVSPNDAGWIRRHRWFPGLAAIAALSLSSMGCGSGGPARFDVSGDVTFQGRPIPAGQIIFDPDPRKGTDGPQGFAHIKNGHYDTRDEGARPVAGAHFVRIDGFDGVPAREMPQGHLIFPRYTTAVELDPSKTEYDFSVPSTPKKP